MVVYFSLPVIGRCILLNFRQNNKEQICSIAPSMNITEAYTKCLELVFVSAATGACVSHQAAMIGREGCSPFCFYRNAATPIMSLH